MTLSTWAMIETIAKFVVAGIGSICVILSLIQCAIIHMNNKGKNIKKNFEVPIFIAAVIFLAAVMFVYIPIYSIYESHKNKQDVIDNKIDSYNSGINFMADGDWYNATIAFGDADDYLDSKVLEEYCLYIHLGEEHPNWVPWMGINDIKEN